MTARNVAQDGGDVHAGGGELFFRPLSLLVGVDDALSHVLLQGGGHAEGHVAESAFVNVLPESSVRLHVPRQLRALRARVAAQLALVRLLAGVRPSVDCQVGAVLENFSAELASVVSTSAGDLFARERVE